MNQNSWTHKKCFNIGKNIEKRKQLMELVDADLLNGGTRHLNLALLKISGFLYDNEIDFRLITDTNEDILLYKKIFISKVFSLSEFPISAETKVLIKIINKALVQLQMNIICCFLTDVTYFKCVPCLCWHNGQWIFEGV